MSAKFVAQAINKNRFDVAAVVIGKDGAWHHIHLKDLIEQNFAGSCFNSSSPDNVIFARKYGNPTLIFEDANKNIPIDVVFPIIHGATGEDGAIQGFCEIVGVPYVGCDVYSSAVCMDKIFSKQILGQSGISVVPFISVNGQHETVPSYSSVTERLKTSNLIIKPSSSGSSIGVSKVICSSEYHKAIETAFANGRKLLIEPALEAREIEVSVLSGQEVRVAAAVGEIIPRHDFYSYEAKYIDPDGAKLVVPAILRDEVKNRVIETAKSSFIALGCNGMARVDFFVTDDDRIYVNEINTIPGFTSISMYPKLWEHSGLCGEELIDTMIENAISNSSTRKSKSAAA
ncbi:D-alanine--D-alanine ligase [Candidatus Hydrogenosomobacter endosymbioticus]|uniref:D-alanine--D-alanine ligase n=2 Tax=Candidatus Hydrogenosomobacter endosymbioticus TaxID=2558174 RepID=A0ABM7V8W5_9PROT|nr:D-alanine--D-alanine ligase [Candidatus Hydrogenosomobacter endosymbioticus]